MNELKIAVEQSNSYTEVCNCLHIPRNGKSTRRVKDLIESYNLSISHWDRRIKLRKYKTVKKTCPVCGVIFDTLSGHRDEKTTCSIGCSNTYFNRLTDESKLKISKSLIEYCKNSGKVIRTNISIDGKKIIKYPNIQITCKRCGKSKYTRKPNQQYCSNKCAAIDKATNPEYIEKLRRSQLSRVKNGTHNGWNSRNITSYPEKFFAGVLNNNGVSYTINKKVDQYFIDFAIEDKMIDLEIDGKQHKYPDRKESDRKRDKYLQSVGWKVYRIEWNSINDEDGCRHMKEKIDKFMKYYHSL